MLAENANIVIISSTGEKVNELLSNTVKVARLGFLGARPLKFEN